MDRTITALLGNKDHDLALLCAHMYVRKEEFIIRDGFSASKWSSIRFFF